MKRSLIIKITGIAIIIWVVAVNLKFFIKKVNNNTEDIDMALKIEPDEQIANTLCDYIKVKYPDYKKRGVYFHTSYLSIPLDVDPTALGDNPMNAVNGFTKGSLYIWDNWYSVVEGGITFESLNNDTTWRRDTVLKANENVPNGLLELALFVRK